MATQAQILANRVNARKSTGPRTVEGKAVVAQNAVKHGLCGGGTVVVGEDPGEFELYRERMVAELEPVGEVESGLVERIVDLAWRLKRAARLQGIAFDSLFARQKNNPMESFDRKQDADGGSVLGRAIVRDFGDARVLDRLSMYERRIEHSLYRTMAELKRHRILQEVGPGKMWELKRALASDEESARSVPVRAYPQPEEEKITPDGVTTNEEKMTPCGPGSSLGQAAPANAGNAASDEGQATKPVAEGENHGRDARATKMLHGSFCKTKPILPPGEDGQVPRAEGLTADSCCEEVHETKPISGEVPSLGGSAARSRIDMPWSIPAIRGTERFRRI